MLPLFIMDIITKDELILNSTGYLFRAGWLTHHGTSLIQCSEEELKLTTQGFFGIYFADFPEGKRAERVSGMVRSFKITIVMVAY